MAVKSLKQIIASGRVSLCKILLAISITGPNQKSPYPILSSLNGILYSARICLYTESLASEKGSSFLPATKNTSLAP